VKQPYNTTVKEEKRAVLRVEMRDHLASSGVRETCRFSYIPGGLLTFKPKSSIEKPLWLVTSMTIVEAGITRYRANNNTRWSGIEGTRFHKTFREVL
jgi:hypothetical protein